MDQGLRYEVKMSFFLPSKGLLDWDLGGHRSNKLEFLLQWLHLCIHKHNRLKSFWGCINFLKTM